MALYLHSVRKYLLIGTCSAKAQEQEAPKSPKKKAAARCWHCPGLPSSIWGLFKIMVPAQNLAENGERRNGDAMGKKSRFSKQMGLFKIMVPQNCPCSKINTWNYDHVFVCIFHLNSGIQTFREPFAALSRSFATAAKHNIFISADVTRILRALHGF